MKESASKYEVKNIWMSGTCASLNCGPCDGRQELDQTIYICRCNCHDRHRWKNAQQQKPKTRWYHFGGLLG